MPKIVGALICRNEADRYLERVLINAGQFCDHIVAIDDGSTDATPRVLDYHGVETLESSSCGFWGHDEMAPRRALWDFARAVDPDGWIYVFDADHELVDLTPADFKLLCRSDLVNAWAFRLYDVWNNESTMRHDEFWRAHLHPRPWLFRALEGPWSDPRGIHTGHAPLRDWVVGEAPGAIRHLGYLTEENRKLKAEKYLKLA